MAQRNTANFKALYGSSGTVFPDNTTRQISESDLRAFGEDLADSFLNRIDGAAATKLEYSGYTGSSVSTNIFDGSELSDGESAKVVAEVILTQTSGTAGASAISFKLINTVRKSSGTLTAVSTSTQTEVYNDTGDSFVGTPSLTVGGSSLNLDMNLTTVKTFKRTYYVTVYRS